MTVAFRSFTLTVATLAFAAAICAPVGASRNGDFATVEASLGAATRDGPRLTLHFASGGSFTYEDAAACHNDDDLDDASCIGYELAGHERAWHLFRVIVHFYEGDSYIFVDDRTGVETLIDGDPRFSQSGNHVVEILHGPDGYDETGPAVQARRRHGGKFIVEWKGAPGIGPGEDGQYQLFAWPTPGRIEFASIKRGEWDRAANRKSADIVNHFTLKRRAKGWQLFRADPK